MERLVRHSLFLFFLLSFTVKAQVQVSFSGKVFDSTTHDPLVGATILFQNNNVGDVSDINGEFGIKQIKGSHKVSISYIGYETKALSLNLNRDTTVNIYLASSTYQTNEVVITGERQDHNLIKAVDNISISPQVFSTIPYLLGEKDPMKALQLMPGVQSNGEGSNGIYVRGGAIDQNLILFDQTPIYNTGHLFGFFSLFNASVIQDINFLKGGIPSYYGGRLSSVVEIDSKNGNYNEYHGETNFGVVSANFVVEGPIVKEKVSFLIGGRRSYIDVISKLVSGEEDIFNTGIDYYFGDLNLKIDAKATEKDKISISAFSGVDDFMFLGRNNFTNTIQWKNRLASIKWDHFYSNDNYHTTTFFINDYDLNFTAGINKYTFSIFSAINELGTKTIWHYNLPKGHNLSFGFEYLKHAIIPNNVRARGEDMDLKLLEQEQLISQEEALFIQDQFEIGESLTIKGGLRLSSYQQIGPFTRYITDKDLTLKDTVQHEGGKIIASYWNLDPRLMVVYRLNQSSSVKASLDFMHQYLHMAPVSSVSLPTDVWVPSSSELKPQRSKQLSAGYYKNYQDNEIEGSVTAYYKDMINQVEYRDGVIIGYSKGFNYDDNFIVGTGKSYGVEFLAKKNTGKLTGWFGYTISKTSRKFPEINQGKRFAAKYDRLHNISIVGNYKLNDRISFSGLFTYASGNAMTLPVGRYIINGNIINEYSGRNTYRMPSYHRLDFSLLYDFKQNKNYQSSLILSVYNLYNRKNPYYIYFDTEGNLKDYSLEVKLEQVSLFPIIPSVSWQIKF